MRVPMVLLAAVFQLAPVTAFAESATTSGFVGQVRAAVGCLSLSSDLAADRAGSRAVRAVARSVDNEAASISAALDDWRRARDEAEIVAENSPSIDHLGPVFGLTRRLSAGAADAVPPDPAVRDLQGLGGAAFDAQFKAVQAHCLGSLIAAYKSFILNGDDDMLRSLAVHRLNRARSLLARVQRL